MNKRIKRIWDTLEANEPDISTERLMAMTIDQYRAETGEDIYPEDVADALPEDKP